MIAHSGIAAFRILSLLLAALIMLAPVDGNAKYNPKYAGLVIELNHDVVLYEDRANARRYPASLTKLMTLYLTFEAMQQGRLTWDKRLPVSARAAKQPQTNIGLRKGDRVTVRDLVDSLIVRSANDSAVVLAEGLGKSEWNFALAMTQKARALGMNKTTFRNASGLPDSKQITTARDMAKLAVALKRDFPEHMHLFKKTRFNYKGRNYYSHNRVLKYFKGSDGMKTGYIRASGFNLVTTASRNGYDVVAVVMGGRTSKRRDRHMVDILNRSFNKLARKNRFELRFASAVPTPLFKDANGQPETLQVNSEPETPAEIAAAALAAVPDGKPVSRREASLAVIPPPKPVGQSTADKADESPSSPALTLTARAMAQTSQPDRSTGDSVESSTINAAPVALAAASADGPVPYSKPLPPARAPFNWGVQVGTFSSHKDAMMAAASAMDKAGNSVKQGSILVANHTQGQATLHRARIAGMKETEARRLCHVLTQKREACFVYKADADI